ncbi:SRPBCC family protein [Plantactinospora sp. GCM10030261]|uniref:SRPBCC family protein n=1 Tax=Plantactinospora sp. GCM10030261 TaxID=3273420 RepID=UPI003606AB71
MPNSLQLTQVPTVTAGMLIRRPPAEVFRAFADPAVTTRFWFTDSTGPLTPGADVRWTWAMFGVGTRVLVTEFEQDSRLVFDWGDDDRTTVEMRFVPGPDDSTYVRMTETGITGSGDEVVGYVADSTGGFTMVLCALKALLEHDVVLTVVTDRDPGDLLG